MQYQTRKKVNEVKYATTADRSINETMQFEEEGNYAGPVVADDDVPVVHGEGGLPQRKICHITVVQ